MVHVQCAVHYYSEQFLGFPLHRRVQEKNLLNSIWRFYIRISRNRKQPGIMAPFDGRQICLPGYHPRSTTHVISMSLLPQVFWNGTTRHSHTGSETVMFSTFHDIIAHRRMRWEEGGEGGGEGGCCMVFLAKCLWLRQWHLRENITK